MSRNKRLIALLLAAALFCPAVLASAELIEPDRIVADVVKYNTRTVRRETLERTINVSGREYYPRSVTLRYEGDEAVYGQVLVKRGQVVKKGDALLSVSVQYDTVQMTEMELAYERAAEDYEKGLEAREEEIDRIERALASEKDEYERQRGTLTLKKLNLALEQYIYQQEYALENRREQIDELTERHEANIVYSPIDGFIDDVAYFREGDRLYGGEVLFEITNTEVFLISAQDNRLRYGMDVTIEAGANKNRTTLNGRVVAAPDCLGDAIGEHALVEVDFTGRDEDFAWRNTRVAGRIIYLENVLLVDRKAVILDGGKYVVTKLTEDGVTQKRFINQGMQTGSDIWVLQGLDEGDVVIVD